MISSLIDAVLLTALAATSFCVILMYRRLQRFDALQSEAAKAFVRSAQALEHARDALETLHDSGGEMAVSLAARLNEARLVINELEEGTRKRSDKARHETAVAASRAQAAATAARAAASTPPPAAANVDFTQDWTDRFDGLGQKAARHRAATHTATTGRAAGTSAAMDSAPLPSSQAPALSWRSIAQAAHRAG
ncbi:MAG: hypothetical protein AcusKO_19440 [Acuticoccus sp.]